MHITGRVRILALITRSDKIGEGGPLRECQRGARWLVKYLLTLITPFTPQVRCFRLVHLTKRTFCALNTNQLSNNQLIQLQNRPTYRPPSVQNTHLTLIKRLYSLFIFSGSIQILVDKCNLY